MIPIRGKDAAAGGGGVREQAEDVGVVVEDVDVAKQPGGGYECVEGVELGGGFGVEFLDLAVAEGGVEDQAAVLAEEFQHGGVAHARTFRVCGVLIC